MWEIWSAHTALNSAGCMQLACVSGFKIYLSFFIVIKTYTKPKIWDFKAYGAVVLSAFMLLGSCHYYAFVALFFPLKPELCSR